MRENATTKAHRYLTEGRVIIRRVDRHHVEAVVRGEGQLHRTTWSAGVWSCICEVRSDQCSHIRALKLVVAVDLGEQP